MQTNNVTNWGMSVRYVRGVTVGLILSHVIAPDAGGLPLVIGACGFFASFLLTPILRAFGLMGLAEHVGDRPTHHEVESDLRSWLDAGTTPPEAVRILHLSRGWGMMELCPAVEKLCNLTQKEAVRFVFLATTETDSESGSQDVQRPSTTATTLSHLAGCI
jgi:hypothetical protein